MTFPPFTRYLILILRDNLWVQVCHLRPLFCLIKELVHSVRRMTPPESWTGILSSASFQKVNGMYESSGLVNTTKSAQWCHVWFDSVLTSGFFLLCLCLVWCICKNICFWPDFAAVYEILLYYENFSGAAQCSLWRCLLFSCDPLMLSQTGSVTREAPLGISLMLLHTAAATFMNNK